MSEHGNAVALREALEKARGVIKAAGGYWAMKTLPIIDAALSVPPRNCDVYQTVDEAFSACHGDRGYLSNPVAERRSTISFMLSCEPGIAQETAEEDCDAR